MKVLTEHNTTSNSHLLNAVLFAGDFGHFSDWPDVRLQAHLQTLAEREIRLGVKRKTELVRQLQHSRQRHNRQLH